MKVVVASKNPVKLDATRAAFVSCFPEQAIEIVGVKAESDVRDQPQGLDETLQGARNRVRNARLLEPEADYWVGLEGGVVAYGAELEVTAWIVVENRAGSEGKAQAATYFLSPAMAELVAAGH